MEAEEDVLVEAGVLADAEEVAIMVDAEEAVDVADVPVAAVEATILSNLASVILSNRLWWWWWFGRLCRDCRMWT